MANRLQITDLDFDTIKNNLKSYLQQQSEFQDYNFEGSGLSVLLDILAYNTHYNAYYINMAANEAFLDTALLRGSVVSHAKTLGYIPRSSSAPKAVINFTVDSLTSTPETLTIPRGFTFSSSLIDGYSYPYTVVTSKTVTKSNTRFHFEELDLYQGNLVTYVFTYNQNSNPKSIFTLPDENIDTTTIEVSVNPNSGNSSSEIYNLVTDVLDITPTSKAFFLQEAQNGFFEIYFGDDVVGKKLEDGSSITVSYLVTQGDESNGASVFVANEALGGYSVFEYELFRAASGGTGKESVDSIKFSARSQFSTQNRLVTFKDYETYILNNYASIDSISVWGGESNDPPVYGKIFISMKPKENYYISETEKQRIINEIVSPKSIVSVSSEILDPEYLYLIIEADVQYDSTKTTQTENELKTDIRNSIISYKNSNLNEFGAKYVHSKIENAIDITDRNAIVGCETIVRAQKRFKPTLNSSLNYTINFNIPLHRGTITNKLTSTEFGVNDSNGVARTVTLEEVPQSYSGISSISITNPGTGYTSAPTVTITGDGTGATAEAVVVNGAIESINVINRGIDYTRAIITISGGNGYGALATAVIDAKTGTLRTVYYDGNAERQIVKNNVGTIEYDTGIISINDLNVTSVTSSDGLIRLSIESNEGIIEPVKNTIITVDENDSTSIVINLSKVKV